MLHALSAESYGKGSWFFFDEGITEYLTRMATVGRFKRNAYPAECDFMNRLVTMGATDDATLARLYFTGDWAGFEATVRKFAGAWISFGALRTLNAMNSLAACDYLEELHKYPEAPLGGYHALLEVLRGVGTTQFTRSAFQEVWERRDLGGEFADSTAGLRALFEFSVIGYLRTGGGGGDSSYAWRYRDTRAPFDESAETFRVHPGFK